MPVAITSVCYVDFSGNLIETACGEPIPEDIRHLTLFMSGATCPRCQQAIQCKILRIPVVTRSADRSAASFPCP